MYDLSAFSGHWPFRRLRRGSLEQQLTLFSSLGFTGGWMSSLDAVFYHDPWEADILLFQTLFGSQWKPVLSINPALPWSEKHFASAAAIRLYPWIHHYRLNTPDVWDLCRAAQACGKPVIITGQMEDPRLCYLLEQTPVPTTDCVSLAEAFPGIRFLLSGFDLGTLGNLGTGPENLWADTAGLCHGLDPIEALTHRGFPLDRLVFGSLSPLQAVQSHLLNIPDAYRQAILTENPQRFMQENPL